MARLATGVTVLTVADGRDDIGGTVSSFASVSADPPIVLVSLTSTGYLTEVMDRQGTFAVSVLGQNQRAIAGRFAAEGRPSARLLLASEPHHRGEHSGALILDACLMALECRVRQRITAGDHVVYLADVDGLPDVGAPTRDAAPLVRYMGRYRGLSV
ncbi:flavin reductase family protein [Lipingzhangella sp. LS1_29]|uniref:Flavin reductase family protein n=1 Tax=Lipingzhangella rawalii TaxID=2055835 RepID=A0ABU2HB31_9ACTN|nr:flavin reductase family protein [Lipingzhangella rawalii]MDS1272030.1 flavin reductase family protein [Lipingzhangella rawalii]